MRLNGQRLYWFEWILCTLWTVIWGGVAYIALTEQRVVLGAGKAGLGAGQYEGAAALLVGLLALGAAIAGIGWLLRTNRYRRALRLVLLFTWIAFFAYRLLALQA